MTKIVRLLLILLIISPLPVIAADAPYKIGPFLLGQDIADVSAFVDMRTELPIRYQENIKEVEIKPIKGFKSGLIAYGSCKAPGQIVRIKLKYADSSKAFFNKLRTRIESRFGKFEEYRGDPFQVVISWKKSFIDDKGNRISLTIQHNNRDDEEKIGNAIKLTMINLLEADCECQKTKTPDTRDKPIVFPVKDPWDLFVPQ